MKTIAVLVLLGALAVGGWLAYRRFFVSAEAKACAAVADRFGLERDRCERALAEVREAAGSEASDRLARCLSDAKSRAEAAGCAAGVGGGLLSRWGLEFLEGLRRSQ